MAATTIPITFLEYHPYTGMTLDEVRRVNRIKLVVANTRHMTVKMLESKLRPEHIAHARMAAMDLIDQMTSLSLNQIGKHFGGRDHGTVFNAKKRVPEICSQNHSYASWYATVKQQLEKEFKA